MPSSHPTPTPCQWFFTLASILDPRSAPRLAWLFVGAVLARGRRTVTSWIRAAGLSDEFRPCYTTVAAAGRRTDLLAVRLAHAVVKPLVADVTRLTFALDDTPTERSGRHVQGAGVHHNPTPGPARSAFVYGHVWVVLGLLVAHPAWGVVALPLLARLYVRAKNLGGTATPAGGLVLTMMAGLARFERELLRERQRRGIDAARARGKHLGRPRLLNNGHLEAALRRLETESLAAVAGEWRVSERTLSRLVNRYAGDHSPLRPGGKGKRKRRGQAPHGESRHG